MPLFGRSKKPRGSMIGDFAFMMSNERRKANNESHFNHEQLRELKRRDRAAPNEQIGLSFDTSSPLFNPSSAVSPVSPSVNPLSPSASSTNRSLKGHLEDGFKKLAQDRAKLSSLNYPVFKGDSTTPISDLTRRSRSIQQHYAGKPAPYSNKIISSLGRKTGFSEEAIGRNLGSTRDRQQGYSSSLIGQLQKRFRSSYDPRVERIQRKTQNDTGRGLNEFKDQLEQVGGLGSNLDQITNHRNAKALQKLQEQKQSQRRSLVNTLGKFGDQQHALGNFQNQADRNSFDEEVRQPFDKADRLERVLTHTNKQMDNMHPDMGSAFAKQLEQTLSAHNSSTQYPGSLMEGSNLELDDSYKLLGHTSPKFRDEFYPQRKELIGKLNSQQNQDSSISDQVLETVPSAISGQVDQLEYAGKKRLKSDLGEIGAKYLKLGQFNSPQHMKASEKRTRELNQSILDQRNKLTEGSLKSGLQTRHQADNRDIKQLGLLGDLGEKEFNNTLQEVTDLNKLGSTEWQNQQIENEKSYKDYQRELLWQWPHMKQQAFQHDGGNALSGAFRGMKGRDIGLDNLSNIDTSYGESKEPNDELTTRRSSYPGEINSLESFKTERQGVIDKRTQAALEEKERKQKELEEQQRRRDAQAAQQQKDAQTAQAAQQQKDAQTAQQQRDDQRKTLVSRVNDLKKKKLVEVEDYNVLYPRAQTQREKDRVAGGFTSRMRALDQQINLLNNEISSNQ